MKTVAYGLGYLIRLVPLAIRTPLHPHLFCHPSSRWSLLQLLKLCLSKYPWGEVGWLFNTLQPHEDPASDIDGVVNHRDWSTAILTQLSFLFILTYPLYFLNPELPPPHVPWCIASLGWTLSLAGVFSLIVISPSYLILPHVPR